MTRRQKAILKRRIFIGFCAAVLALTIFFICFFVKAVFLNDDDSNSDTSSIESKVDTVDSTVEDSSSKVDSQMSASSDKPNNSVGSQTAATNNKLDADFSMLLLVNADNPLPDTYDSEVRKDLVEIDPKYRNNNYVTQIHKDVYPYVVAMVSAAQKDGVDLRVWSPFRSYAIQKDLFQKQVNRVGGDEALAATVVARPGTSEHNTGLCADFNMASDAFENTAMYSWMKENAEDYGFVMRYRKDKQPITGVIHESWHWRFVGINHAKQMNKLDMCLEEYVEWLKKEQ